MRQSLEATFLADMPHLNETIAKKERHFSVSFPRSNVLVKAKLETEGWVLTTFHLSTAKEFPLKEKLNGNQCFTTIELIYAYALRYGLWT